MIIIKSMFPAMGLDFEHSIFFVEVRHTSEQTHSITQVSETHLVLVINFTVLIYSAFSNSEIMSL